MTRVHRLRGGFTYVELLVILGVLVLALAFLLPACTRVHHGESRTKCSSNLRQIGQAMLLYANENKGQAPRTRYVRGPVVRPTWGTGAATADPFSENGPQPNDVSAAAFLLLRTQDITSDVFICPSSDGERDTYGGGTNSAVNRSNFTDVRKNLTYSFHNPYPNDGIANPDGMAWWTVNKLSSDFAIAADIGPGTTGGDDNVFLPTSSSSAAAMKSANSANHDRDGENVLYSDGHVEFSSNPFAGSARDNIYTTRDGQVIASPVDTSDSILLPTDD